MNRRQGLVAIAIGSGLIGLWLPGGYRETVDTVAGVLIPVLLWWEALRKLAIVTGLGAFGAAIILTLATWSLLTLGLLAVGSPINRATAAGCLVGINLVAYLAGVAGPAGTPRGRFPSETRGPAPHVGIGS